MRPRKRLLQFLQLKRRERRSVTSLLPSRLILFELALSQLTTSVMEDGGVLTFPPRLLVHVVNVDLLLVVEVVVVIEPVAGIGLAGIFAAGIGVAVLRRSGLVLVIEQLKKSGTIFLLHNCIQFVLGHMIILGISYNWINLIVDCLCNRHC